MALAQTHLEPYLPADNFISEAASGSVPSEQNNRHEQPANSIHSTKSWQSFRSLRSLPYVETSFDHGDDSIVGEHNSTIPDSFTTPVFSGRIETSSPISLGRTESPWSRRSRVNTPAQPSQTSDIGNENSLFALEKELTMSQARLNALNSINSEEKPHSTLQTMDKPDTILNQGSNIMNSIAEKTKLLTSLKNNVNTWAPIAHALVVNAAALQRDTVAFASTLITMMSTGSSFMNDPNTFTSQYYQLKEAYSMLLTSTDIGGQCGTFVQNQGFTPSTKQVDSLDDVDNGAWDDRQLVDSFMTLLRTSPGFIVSAMEEMTAGEFHNFCADGDGSALNVYFHGFLGSSSECRPLVLAEIINLFTKSSEKLKELTSCCLRQFISLSIGNINNENGKKLDRFLRYILAKKPQYEDFEIIMECCLHKECITFLQSILIELSGSLSNKSEIANISIPFIPFQSARSHQHNLTIFNVVTETLMEFTKQLIVNPHQFGILLDTYIGEKQRSILENAASCLKPQIDKFLQSITEAHKPEKLTKQLWKKDELIVVKGSDILLMFNSLLPGRAPQLSNANESFTTTGTFTNDDEEEWCLESIRTDLAPVMQGLYHSTLVNSDGWQIFKIGEDGLITDLGSDMGLFSYDIETQNPKMEVVCEAISRYDFDTVSERIEAYRKNARLDGDFFALQYLENVSPELDDSYLNTINLRIDALTNKQKFLRVILDNATRNQHSERLRLFKLIRIMDSARVHMWYETEVKLGTPYFKSREFLQLLYPKGRDEEANQMDTHLFGNAGDAGSSSSSSISSSTTSRRLSILSAHSTPESPFYSKESLASLKLTDKEVDKVLHFMKQYKVRNAIPAEERFHRALVEVAYLARKVLDRDHLASYITFKRDRHFQTQFSQQMSQNGLNNTLKRNSQRHRRSSLSLFDFFDSGNSNQSGVPVTLHSATSSQLLGLSSSHESLRRSSHSTLKYPNDGRASRTGSGHQSINENGPAGNPSSSNMANIDSDIPCKVGPPKWPSIYEVQSLIISDIGHEFMVYGTETDKFMEQTGRMVLGGDGTLYQPILEDISIMNSPESKLSKFDYLLRYAKFMMQQRTQTRVSRAELIHELTKTLGRETGTLYRDLQVVCTLVDPNVLDNNEGFNDIFEATANILNMVVVKSMDYASRFLRYCMETNSTHQAPRMVMMGINDAVLIWAFCAKNGNREAQRKLSELYMKFKHIAVDIKPLTKPSHVFDGLDHNSVREVVATHWLNVSSRI